MCIFKGTKKTGRLEMYWWWCICEECALHVTCCEHCECFVKLQWLYSSLSLFVGLMSQCEGMYCKVKTGNVTALERKSLTAQETCCFQEQGFDLGNICNHILCSPRFKLASNLIEAFMFLYVLRPFHCIQVVRVWLSAASETQSLTYSESWQTVNIG